jgi:hypothetical protein
VLSASLQVTIGSGPRFDWSRRSVSEPGAIGDTAATSMELSWAARQAGDDAVGWAL